LAKIEELLKHYTIESTEMLAQRNMLTVSLSDLDITDEDWNPKRSHDHENAQVQDDFHQHQPAMLFT